MANNNIVKFRLSDEDFKDINNRLNKINGRLTKKGLKALTLSGFVRIKCDYCNDDDLPIRDLMERMKQRPRSFFEEFVELIKKHTLEEDGKREQKP